MGRLVAWGVDGARSSCSQELKRAVRDALVHQAHLELAGSVFDRGGDGAQGGGTPRVENACASARPVAVHHLDVQLYPSQQICLQRGAE